MNAQEHKAKINASQANNYQVMRAMSDVHFNEYEIWNAAKAIKWTIATGRISAEKEWKFEQMTGEETVDMVYKVAEMAEEVCGAEASRAFVKIMASV